MQADQSSVTTNWIAGYCRIYIFNVSNTLLNEGFLISGSLLFVHICSETPLRDVNVCPRDICGHRRLKSACASMQSDQGLRCPLQKHYYWLFWQAQTTSWQGWCAGWFGLSLFGLPWEPLLPWCGSYFDCKARIHAIVYFLGKSIAMSNNIMFSSKYFAYIKKTSLTLVLLNKLRCHTFFKFSANQITWSRLLI